MTEDTRSAFARAVDALLEAEGLTPEFPPEVLAEVATIERAPGIHDPSLLDLTALPFVTVDGEGTRDLDQALHVEQTGEGFRLRYAIADAAFYVSPRTALLNEAVRRGASYYLPDRSVPMLPRALSEGLVSLSEGVDRRALVFDVRLDARGTVQSFALERARVHSRAKLSFGEVDALFERGALPRSVREQQAVEASLRAMGELGPLRAHHEERKQVARYRRVEAEVKLDASGSLRVGRAPRGAAELANEQLSILCNALGGRYLRDALAAGGTGAHVQPVYRVHEPPAPERVEGFERLVARLARSRGLPDDPWVYRQAADAGLAGYLDALPTEGDAGRLARALHRQAMLLQGRSRFSADEAGHHGVGEAVYSRFTAPMREIVGVYCHTQAIERLVGEASRPDAEDVALRDVVIDAANRAKDQQRRLDREVDRWTLEAALAPDLARDLGERPERTATVMGVSSSRLHLLLDDVPLDVTLLFYDLGQALGGAWLEQADEGARVAVKATGKTVCHLGDQVAVRAWKPGTVVLSGASLDRARLALRR